ncbi:MAG: DUF697 domain-containing protein [Chlorobiales bacterium]|nr:DUF697 domain-containing protein [Chlorobiales bacterium]
MKKKIGGLLVIGTLFMGVLLIVFITNQTIQLVRLVETSFNPQYAHLLLYSLLTLYGIVFFSFVIGFIKAMRASVPPPETNTGARNQYLKTVSKRVSYNQSLQQRFGKLSDRARVEAALKELDTEALETITNTATACFVGSAISRSSRQDSSMIMVSHLRMIWKIAHLYNPNASWRELFWIYKKVVGTALLVTEIDESELQEQVEPVIKATFGTGLGGPISGFSVINTLLTNSILEGTINAYITLRIGIVCRMYCSALTLPDPDDVRSSANEEAGERLYDLAQNSSDLISRVIRDAASKASADIFENVRQNASSNVAKEVVSNVAKTISSFFSEREQKRERGQRARDEEAG